MYNNSQNKKETQKVDQFISELEHFEKQHENKLKNKKFLSNKQTKNYSQVTKIKTVDTKITNP